jgi:hypothetical protein
VYVFARLSSISQPLKSPNMAEVVSQWDAEFVDVDQELLFELILAANYMDIKPLLDLSCAKVRRLTGPLMCTHSSALSLSALPLSLCPVLIPFAFSFLLHSCFSVFRVRSGCLDDQGKDARTNPQGQRNTHRRGITDKETTKIFKGEQAFDLLAHMNVLSLLACSSDLVSFVAVVWLQCWLHTCVIFSLPVCLLTSRLALLSCGFLSPATSLTISRRSVNHAAHAQLFFPVRRRLASSQLGGRHPRLPSALLCACGGVRHARWRPCRLVP